MEDKKHYRILIARTDRIGDVVLSTPVIESVRKAYPQGHLAFMTGPATKDIVAGNPYLDEVIVYDKDNEHKSWASSIRFAIGLRRKKFDLAIILHPTNRAHITCWLAGIKKRLGYDKKFGFLLTDRVKDMKFEGVKHESDYALDLLKGLGIRRQDKVLYMPVKEEDRRTIRNFLKINKVKKGELIVAINPGASCPSKIWPAERFAQVAEALSDELGARIVIVSGKEDINIAQDMQSKMKHRPMFMAGKTTLGELAALLEICGLFISNDSGPVHIAAAVGAPVISIFGRKQPGLGPTRWKPLGKNDIVFHKNAGCAECLAHDCKNNFRCLLSITAQEVVNAARRILTNKRQDAPRDTAVVVCERKEIMVIPEGEKA